MQPYIKGVCSTTSKKRNGGATILVGSATILEGGATISALLCNQAFEDFQPKYDIMVEGANSRGLHLARRAECRRILRNNPGVREAEKEQQ
jgi:hypothetical protein